MGRFLDWISRKAGLDRHEAKGGLVLLCLVSVTVIVPLGTSTYFRSKSKKEFDLLVRRLETMDSAKQAGIMPASSSVSEVPDSPAAGEGKVLSTASIRKVDPNVATIEELEAVGIPSHLAKRVTRYVAAGGSFSKPGDIRKIYGFSEATYQKVRASLVVKGRSSDLKAVKVKNVRKLDVNSADSVELEGLPGIGDFTANSIVKYRKLLGGYIDLDQLYELYYQDSARTRQYSKHLYIKPGFEPVKLRVNTADQNRLYHPYLSKTSSKLISAYIRQNGYLKSWEELRSHRLVSDEELEKLRPYLSFD